MTTSRLCLKHCWPSEIRHQLQFTTHFLNVKAKVAEHVRLSPPNILPRCSPLMLYEGFYSQAHLAHQTFYTPPLVEIWCDTVCWSILEGAADNSVTSGGTCFLPESGGPPRDKLSVPTQTRPFQPSRFLIRLVGQRAGSHSHFWCRIGMCWNTLKKYCGQVRNWLQQLRIWVCWMSLELIQYWTLLHTKTGWFFWVAPSAGIITWFSMRQKAPAEAGIYTGKLKSRKQGLCSTAPPWASRQEADCGGMRKKYILSDIATLTSRSVSHCTRSFRNLSDQPSRLISPGNDEVVSVVISFTQE